MLRPFWTRPFVTATIHEGSSVHEAYHVFGKMSENPATFEKMTADFLSMVSHELRSPLTCIKGYVGALRATLPPSMLANEEIARYLDRIDREADLMASKVSELHVLGMIEAGELRLEPREIPTNGFLLMIGESFRPIAAERRIDFTITTPDVPHSFVGDPERLNQVFLKLLHNAFKYTPPGGRIAFKGSAGDGTLEIEVSDGGPGIPPEHLEVLFEKHDRMRTRSNRQGGGAGLGLAVANGIVLAHKGTILVTSVPGMGARFVVRLPLQTGAQPASPQEQEEVA